MPFASASASARHAAALKKSPLHPSELTLALLLGAWLGFLPWAFGTMHSWAQFTALGIAAAAFLVALLPRRLNDGEIVAHPARVLVRLPAFWLGLALLAYVSIQAANPAWTWESDGRNWWLRKREALQWLPSGIDAPFERMNGWRTAVIWAAPLLAGCAAWIGITRRRTAQALLTWFVLNSTAVSVLGMLQRFTGTAKIYWTYAFNAEVFGCFVYRNHGAAYLLLGLAAALGLGMRHYLHGEMRGARSTPAPVFAFLAVLIACGVVVSTSRLGAIVGTALTGSILFLFSWHLWQSHLARRTLPAAAAVVVLAFGGWFLSQVDLDHFFARFRSLTSTEGEASLGMRVMGADMAREMWLDHPATGIGAGGFRHLEPAYAPRHPALEQDISFGDLDRAYSGRFWMHDAHNDHLQLLAELGVLGAGLAYGLVAIGLAALGASRRRFHPLASSMLAGAIGLLAYAALDFPLLNPAVLGSTVLAMTLASRWADLEPPFRAG